MGLEDREISACIIICGSAKRLLVANVRTLAELSPSTRAQASLLQSSSVQCTTLAEGTREELKPPEGRSAKKESAREPRRQHSVVVLALVGYSKPRHEASSGTVVASP